MAVVEVAVVLMTLYLYPVYLLYKSMIHLDCLSSFTPLRCMSIQSINLVSYLALALQAMKPWLAG